MEQLALSLKAVPERIYTSFLHATGRTSTKKWYDPTSVFEHAWLYKISTGLTPQPVLRTLVQESGGHLLPGLLNNLTLPQGRDRRVHDRLYTKLAKLGIRQTRKRLLSNESWNNLLMPLGSNGIKPPTGQSSVSAFRSKTHAPVLTDRHQ